MFTEIYFPFGIITAQYQGEKFTMNKEYRDIDATLAGLNKSSDAHFKWLVNLLYFVANKNEHSPEITNLNAHERCEFGLWLSTKLKEERDDKSYLLEIHKQHQDIHQKCRELMSSLSRGDESDMYFGDFSTSLLAFNQSLALYKTHLLQRRTSYDALTGLPLRRILDESFDNTLSEFVKSGLYLFLLDIDHFKKINDNYGHLAGDDVLRSFAVQLENGTRKCEPVYRYGGEEFIILIHAANDHDACKIAERLRTLIADTEMNAGGTAIKITFSGGLTKICEKETLHEVLERADSALYQGKQSGRNRCIYVDRDFTMRHIVL